MKSLTLGLCAAAAAMLTGCVVVGPTNAGSALTLDVTSPDTKFIDNSVRPAKCGEADGWAAMNSVKVWEQLHRMGIQGEVHTLATRKHCFQFKAAPGTGSYTYLDRIWEFLNAKGFNR